MAEITIDMIKELRDRTGIGMGACKKALMEANGDMDQAITDLRKAGMASAVKKEGRETNEGVIIGIENDKRVALVEVNAETDFVVKNDVFQEFSRNIAEEVLATNPASLEAFLAQKYSKDPAMTIEEYRASMVQKIGENIKIRRLTILPKTSDNSIGVYTHLGGKLVVTVELSGKGEEALAKDIAMHIAAASPEFLSPKFVPADVIANEKDIIKEQIKGKPENMVEKIVEGKLQAFYKENCLTDQPYIKDDKKTVSAVVAERAKASGKQLDIVNFMRWTVSA